MIPHGPVCTNLYRILDYECDEIDALRRAFSVEHECFFGICLLNTLSLRNMWLSAVGSGLFLLASLLAPKHDGWAYLLGFGNSAIHLALARTMHCSTFTTPCHTQHQLHSKRTASTQPQHTAYTTASCSSLSSCCPEPQADPGCRTTLAILASVRQCMRGNNPSGHSGAIRRARGCAITSHNRLQTNRDAEDHCRTMMNKDVARSCTF